MTARIKDSDIEHLSWIYDRLANVHSENTNFDYMHKLNAIIANLKLDYAYYGDLVLHREEVRPVGELIETPEEKEALDEKTYRYEKVTDSIFDLKEEFERGELFSFDGNEHYVQIETEGDFSYAHIYENLYRRIEVTERDLFIEEACKRCNYDPNSAAGSLIGDMYDAGCRFVNGKG